MYKLRFFVHCNGWVGGGYENVHYFEKLKEADNYCKNKSIEKIALEKVSPQEFAEDCIAAL